MASINIWKILKVTQYADTISKITLNKVYEADILFCRWRCFYLREHGKKGGDFIDTIYVGKV